MSKILRKYLLVCGIVFLLVVPAVNAQSSQDNTVYHFFSFLCPHCYKHDLTFDKWGKSLPAPIVFKSVPVINNSRWQVQAARAYYTALRADARKAEAMKIAVFKLTQNHPANTDMARDKTYYKLAEQLHFNMDIFNKLWWSDKVKTDLIEAYNLLREYHISNIPCLVIGGKMLTPDMAGGNYQRFFQLGNAYASRILDGSIENVTLGGPRE